MHCEICLSKIAISSPERSFPLSSGMGNKDHCQYAFELGISSAINRACAVPPEVEKYIFSQISNSKLRAGDVQVLGTMVSSTKVQNSVVLRHINQQDVRRCCNFSNFVPRAFSSTIFKMADRREKTLANAELTPSLIGPFIRTR